MTHEQKIEYVRKLSNEELLHKYAVSTDRVSNIFDWVNRGYDFNEIMESEDILLKECLRRMNH